MEKTSEDNRYSFVTGRVRAREAMLFDRTRYEQFVAAEDEETLLKHLANSPYAQFQKASTQEILNDARNENFQFLKKYCLDNSVLNLFMHREDLHNLKLLLKTELAKAAQPEIFISSFGAIPVVVLKETIQTALAKEGSVFWRMRIPEFIKKGTAQAIAAFETFNDPALVDIEIDKAAMTYLIALAQISGFLHAFYQHRIDLENIRTFLRVMISKEERNLFNQAFIPGGIIKFSYFPELPTDSADAVIERFSFTPYRFVVNDGVQYLMNNKSFQRFERLAAEYLLIFLRRARYFTFGFEPLVGYFLYKENEIINLGKIYQGIMSKANKDQIRESLAYA
ncbi:MAG: V-type ATPase subunit [candidate division WOR-3 bacterium]|nr:V-type ATPase subunit [candidate division WOR-3 bacterium]MDH5682924.1 V-type ATPase subunit [candidate division WOR-3 bacterium]